MKKNIFNIIQLFIDDLNPLSGVDAISLVTEPAIERDFVHFHKEYMTDFKQVEGEQRKVVGPLLVPNKMILRKLKDEYFYVYFDKETIAKTAERFQKNGFQNNATVEHTSIIDNVTFIETWIKEDNTHDKSLLYGFEDMPIGTWFGMAKINDDETWEKIKNGEIRGFSIEGRYTDQILKNSKVEDAENTVEQMILEGTDEEKELYKNILELLNQIDEEEIK